MCARRTIFRVCLLVLVISDCYCVDIEKYLKTCDRNSPDVNDCLVDAVQYGLQVMSDGIKEFGVPPVDPYFQKEIRVDYKNNQIAVKMIMRNIYVWGMRDSKVRDVSFSNCNYYDILWQGIYLTYLQFASTLRADEDNFLLEIDMSTPKVFVNGTYHGEGGWNALVINTTGTFNTTMRGLTYTWKIAGKPEKIDGETYVRLTSFYMRPDLEDLKAYVTNDDPATQELTNLGNNFANNNWKSLYRELLPYAQDNWNRIGIRVGNKLFLKVPYDQLFPIKS